MTTMTTTTPHRLEPIKRSWNPLVWLISMVYRVTIGHDLPVTQVVFARAPGLILGHMFLLATAEYLVSLDGRTLSLVRVLGSRVNNCMFCDDLESHMALQHKALTREELDAVPHYATSVLFTERERAALKYIEQVNTAGVADDSTFAALQAHFTDKQVVEITWINGVNNYLNMVAKPLGLTSQGYCAIGNANSRNQDA